MKLRTILFVSLGLLAVMVAINWQDLAFAYAMATSERRPALLADADWKKPGSAAFKRRFAAGVPERELLSWLADNRFDIDRKAHGARHLVRGLPCNEKIEISWSVTADDRLRSADALVSEAGCL